MNKLALLGILIFLSTSCSGLEREPEKMHFAVGPTAPSLATGESPAQAEKKPSAPSEEELKEANNPLANMKAMNLHDYYIPEFSDTDEWGNVFWLRYAQPIETESSTWLVRASIPLQRMPTGPHSSAWGVGDSNVFAAYLVDSGTPGVSLGIGPLAGLPTAMKDAFRTSQWSAGLAAVAFDMRSAKVQYGSLLTYQHKIFGSDRAPDVNLLTFQPFGMYQLGGGNYLRSSSIWTFDLQQGYYTVPIGLGIGNVMNAGDTVLNFFIEPQVTVLSDGYAQPEFQLFFGVNMQFK